MLDIVFIEGKQAVTAATVAAAEAQQTPQGTLPSLLPVKTQDSQLSLTDKEKSPECRLSWKMKAVLTAGDNRRYKVYGAFTELLQGDKF